MNHVSKAIRDEAKECAESSHNHRNSSEDRNIFYVVSIVLNGIADKLGEKPTSPQDTQSADPSIRVQFVVFGHPVKAMVCLCEPLSAVTRRLLKTQGHDVMRWEDYLLHEADGTRINLTQPLPETRKEPLYLSLKPGIGA